MEKSTLGKDTTIDDKDIGMDAESISGRISDAFSTIKDKITHKDNKPDTKDKPSENFKRDLKIQKRKERVARILDFLRFITEPDTYADFIQKFETLLMVIFIDSFFVLLLLSMLYGVYIIYNFDSYNIITAISKFAGSIIISIICIIVQINVHSKPNKT